MKKSSQMRISHRTSSQPPPLGCQDTLYGGTSETARRLISNEMNFPPNESRSLPSANFILLGQEFLILPFSLYRLPVLLFGRLQSKKTSIIEHPKEYSPFDTPSSRFQRFPFFQLFANHLAHMHRAI